MLCLREGKESTSIMSILCSRLVTPSVHGIGQEANRSRAEIKDMWKGKNSLGKKEEDQGI